MRGKIQTYVYKNREYIGCYPSIAKASIIAKLSPTTVQDAIKNHKTTRKGYYFSEHELTQEEIDNIYVSDFDEGYKKRGKNCSKKILQFEYQTECDPKANICYVPRSRKERISLLRQYIYKNSWTRWETLPKKMSVLEKTFVRELLDSLE